MSPIETQNKVTAKFKGRLGNQMFQIAAATGLAEDNGARAVFPQATYFKAPWAGGIQLETYEKNVFNRLDISGDLGFVEYHYKQPGYHYTPIPYKPNMMIDGYFQSEKFFFNHKDKILSLFAPTDEILNYLATNYGDLLLRDNTVAINVRRTDYLILSALGFIGTAYYSAALKTFPSDSHFVVCSDDISWCKSYFGEQEGNFQYIEGEKDYIVLYLMSQMKHNIIANSSFAWWGAYLNQNPERRVVSPSADIWLKGAARLRDKTCDLLPNDWEQIK